MKNDEKNDKIDFLWQQAKKIYLNSLVDDDVRNRAERNLSMVTNIYEQDGHFEILTKNPFVADLLRDEHCSQLRSSLILAGATSSKGEITLEFKCDEDVKQTIEMPEENNVSNKNNYAENIKNDAAHYEKFNSTMPLTPEYTFDEFVRGPSNSIAYAAAINVADRPASKGYNPLFIHGGTGLGKTHLMQAIGNEIIKKKPKAMVCYLSAEMFLNEYINALQNKTLENFRQRYRSIDILLVDDIQFIATKKNFQEEFFNTFNSLYMANKQIVMTSDVAPSNLQNFEIRLVSRFQGGMVQEIELPSYETRLAILRKKVESLDQRIDDRALQFIAEHIKSHVRAMEGALSKICVMMKIDPTLCANDNALHKLLEDFIEKDKSLNKISVEEIQNTVCKKYGISMAQMLSKERTLSIVTPRQLAMYIARKYTNKSLPEIAKLFDKQHATIIHGVKTIEKRLDVEDNLKGDLVEIVNQLGISAVERID